MGIALQPQIGIQAIGLHGATGLDGLGDEDLDGSPVDPSGNVFLFRGRPVGDLDEAFKSACKRAGIAYGQKMPKGVTFHTLRYTYASWLAIRGIPIKTIQELMGRKDIRMTMRYAHLSEQVKKML
jgi:integrase